jgi:hypothetical protein
VLKRVLRYTLTALAGLLALIVLVWIILLVYVNANEKSLIQRAGTAIKNRTHGDVRIGGLSVSFFRTFPLLSLQLKDVELRDSLYPRHHKPLLKATDVYLRASIRGLLTNTRPVGRVIIRNGEVNLVTDTAGFTNEYVLKSDKPEPSESFSMPDIVLHYVTLSYENPLRGKLYHALVRSLRCSAAEKKDHLLFHVNVRMLVKNLSFNTIKGAYLEEKLVDGKFDLAYYPSSQDIIADHVTLYLGGHPFMFDGKFNTNNNDARFRLAITTKDVLYKRATSFLTSQLRKKLNKYSVVEPVDLQVNISGKTAYESIPLVEVFMQAKNNRVLTPKGVFELCSFNGSFSNEKVKGKPRFDENSFLQFKDFSGKWEGIRIRSKNILIANLTSPFLECDVLADVDMESLNNLAGSSVFRFKKGKMSLDVVYKGSVDGDDSTGANINGGITFHDAAIQYLPRNFNLSKCEGSLRFVNNDLFVHKFTALAGKTKLVMNGSAKNFLSLLDVSPEKLVLDWQIKSPAIHLADFRGFLSKSKARDAERKEARFRWAASKVDRMFSEGDMYIRVQSPSMDYGAFTATDIDAKVVLKPTAIACEKANMKHAGGSMEISGSLKNGAENNPVSLKAVMRDMDVPRLFAAFNNFGQDAVTEKNLNGTMSANIIFNTAINNDAELVREQSEGSIFFLLENGELNNFGPLLEISKKAFKKQDFSHIRFADLGNRLDIKGSAFVVNRMEIRSTALNFTVEGVYDVKKGTDMSIRFPLNNLTRSQAKTDISAGGKARKGVSLRLRAKTGSDGKLQITWDPFRRSLKNKDDVKDSAGSKS